MKCLLKERFKLKCGECDGNKICYCDNEDSLEYFLDFMIGTCISNKLQEENRIKNEIKRMEKLNELF